MTQRLYYSDPYKREFEASIAGVGEREGRPAVRLDQTAFYPTSGGQPFDTGTLTVAGGAPIGIVKDRRGFVQSELKQLHWPKVAGAGR
jgi:alanyl-tRNA synthetase